MKSIYIVVFSFIVIVLGLPSVIVIAFGTNTTIQDTPDITTLSPTHKSIKNTETYAENITVSVYRMNNQEVENLYLEEYLKGVLAAEMPASYELEALKAQAISARTYILRFLMSDKKNRIPEVPQGADITDSTSHQVYKSQDELKAIWKNDNFDKYIRK